MTNTLKPHYDHWKTLQFETYFDGIFRSDTDHFIKPEKQSYLFVLDKIGGQPHTCVFVDNLHKNVEGAKAVGMRGIVYKSNKLLITDFHKLGIKI
jgi:HAD superfamily hydrolase (TIGR01509 family)